MSRLGKYIPLISAIWERESEESHTFEVYLDYRMNSKPAQDS